MKRIILSIFICSFFSTAYGQFEVKVNPIELLLKRTTVSGEYITNKNLGFELSVGFVFGTIFKEENTLDESGFRIRPSIKYHFGGRIADAGLHVGSYLVSKSTRFSEPEDDTNDAGFKESELAVGGLLGFKHVKDNGLIIELGGGIGAPLDQKRTYNNTGPNVAGQCCFVKVDFFLTIAIGYRFGKVKK